jgi:hypothetical protein
MHSSFKNDNPKYTKMMELVDILGLGSSSLYKSKGSNPFFGKIF